MKTSHLTAAILALLNAGPGQTVSCPVPMHNAPGYKEGAKVAVFPTGEIVSLTAMAVNPDGTTASYTFGDHGFTYIANGVNRIVDGKKRPCTGDNRDPECRTKWLEAEAAGFAPGTAEFCAFAIEVDPFTSGGERVPCEGKDSGRWTIGNGKGLPRPGPTVASVDGQGARTYVSTTSLRHMVDGKPTYVDSALIPSLVVPKGKGKLLGTVAWVKWGKYATFAVFGDVGPSFGEGSLALHQMLRRGHLDPPPPSGPIPLALRCGPLEKGLLPPFSSRPDIPGDKCTKGKAPEKGSDIRGYAGIENNEVITIILGKVRLSQPGKPVQTTITMPYLEKMARDAGYTDSMLNEMAQCMKS